MLTLKSEFVRNIATLMSGRGLAAGIAFLTMPIVARLFVPGDFGVAAIFVSIIAIAIIFSTMGFQHALVLPKSESDARLLLDFVYRVVIASCVLILFLLTLYKLSGAELGVLDALGSWIWLLPLGVFLLAAIETQEKWLTRHKAFRSSSLALVIGNSTTSGARITVGLVAGSSLGGLVFGYLVGSASRLAIQMRSVPPRGRVFRRTDFRVLLETGKRYRDFPLLNAPASLVFAVGANLPVLLFGFLFSPEIVGFYAMAHRLAEVPLSILANSVRAVFLQKAAEIQSQAGGLGGAFLQLTGGLALIGAIPALILGLAGQSILVWLLGETWKVAGHYLEILAPLLFVGWIASPTGPIFVVLRKQPTWLFLQILMTTLRLSVFGISYVIGADADWTLKAFVAATICGYVAEWLGALAVISQPRRSLHKSHE